jgi:hypothetical protein
VARGVCRDVPQTTEYTVGEEYRVEYREEYRVEYRVLSRVQNFPAAGKGCGKVPLHTQIGGLV